MSKRKPSKPVKKAKKKAPSSTATSKAYKGPTLPPSLPAAEGSWRMIFWALTGALGILLIIFAFGSGVNGDDIYQYDYSEKLVQYYSTFGENQEALNIPKGNMHYYGGFFDTVAGFLNKLFGFEQTDLGYHHVRHVLIALFGLLAMLFTGLLTREIAGWRAAVLALVIIYLSPRFFGHSLMNPKDIPFAAGNVIALYYMTRWLRKLPEYHWRDLLGLAVGIGIAISTRAGGLLLFAYVGLFAGIDFLLKYGFQGLASQPKALGRYAATGIVAALAGYILAILFWPFALQSPIANPLEALTEFSKLGVKIRVLFEGVNIMSDTTPWYYPLSWIVRTIPLPALIGFVGATALSFWLVRKYWAVPVLLCFFATIFPLAYVIYKDSLLHDGWRHLTFVYPSLVVLAALFWVLAEEWLRKMGAAKYALWGILALGLIEPAVYIARNATAPYTYFSPIMGGISGAFGEYETDYWGVTVKDAIHWLEEEGHISPDQTDTTILATTFSFNSQRYLAEKYKGKVKTIYVRYNERYNRDWDYGIFPSRYVRGPHLRQGSWPTSRSIHTITANGVPLTAIMERKADEAFIGLQAVKNRDWTTALANLPSEVQKHPDNELAWLGLANAYINTGKFKEASEAAQNALKVAPDNTTGLSFLGISRLNAGDPGGALEAFGTAVKKEPNYAAGHYYMALAFQARGELNAALQSLENCLSANAKFMQAYELAASILDKQGKTQQANQIRQRAQSVQ
ncbi:MAG: tetratricopeptide repeat protein [Bacteroidota bacterium]